MPETFRIGLLGHGTVGSAFAELLEQRADAIVPVTGAYGHAMASNYTGIRRPPAAFAAAGDARAVVRRETYEDLGARDV